MNSQLPIIKFIIVGLFGLPVWAQAASTAATVVTKPGATANAPSSTASGNSIIDTSVPFLEPYVFDLREGRRNPFQPPAMINNSAMNAMLPGSPLERYDLNEIKLVGIMWNIKRPKAMFIDPLGNVYILGIDDRIGRKHGYIAAIRNGEVVVMEASNYNGQPTYRPRILQIDNASK